MTNYKKTHPRRVSIFYTSYDSDLESYAFFNPWNFINSDENNILIYSYCNKKHTIIINSKTFDFAIETIKKIKIILEKEKNIIIQNKHISWQYNDKEHRAAQYIGKWCIEHLYNPRTHIGHKYISKYFYDPLTC